MSTGGLSIDHNSIDATIDLRGSWRGPLRPGHKTLTMHKLPRNGCWKLVGGSNVTIIHFAA